MEQPLTFIDADTEDATLLSATAILSKQNWGYSNDLMELWRPDLEITPDYIRKNKVLKVFHADLFLGFFALKFENDTAELDHLWLSPEQMRRNVGRSIFQFIKQYLKEIRIYKMILTAEPHASGFYDKMGGKVIGTFESKISGRMLDIYKFEF